MMSIELPFKDQTFRTAVRFAADFPAELDGSQPPSRELAELISKRLEEAGFKHNRSTNRSIWGWGFKGDVDQLKVVSVIGLIDEDTPVTQQYWMITNDCELGLFKRLLGRRSLLQKRDEILRTYCDALHQILCADPRFSQVAWYETADLQRPVKTRS